LTGVERLDVVRLDEGGNIQTRHLDVPFDAVAGEVLLCPAAASIRLRSSFRETMRLIGIDAAGERVLGDYVFDHRPS
jgi:hypothetical protein